MSFTNQIQYLHSQLAPDTPIEVFADSLRPAAIGLESKAQFYAPIRFAVQIAGEINSPAGAFRVDVPVHANPNWLNDMKRRFAGMIGLKNSLQGSDMQFRTVSGVDISKLSVDVLPHVGKLNVFVNNKKVRMPTMPTIPVEYSVCKEANIQQWIQQVASDLPDLVAKELAKQQSDLQIDAAIRGDGTIVKLIQDKLLAAAPAPRFGGGSNSNAWTEFLRTHHMNSPDVVSEKEAKDALTMVSKDLLSSLRQFVVAAKQPIGAHLANLSSKKIAKELAGREDAEHYKPLLSSASGGAGKQTNAYDLFHKIAEDAFASPFVQQGIISTIYNRPLEAGCRWAEGKKATEEKKTVSEAREQAKPAEESEDAAEAKAAVAAEKARIAKEKAAASQSAKDKAAAAEAERQKDLADAEVARKQKAADDAVEALKRKEEEEKSKNAPEKTSTKAPIFSQAAQAIVDRIRAAEEKKVNTVIARMSQEGLFSGQPGFAVLEELRKIYVPSEKPAKTGTEDRKDFVKLIAPLIRQGDSFFPQAQISAHHPWNAQIHHTLQPMADGVYPAYYNVLHTKQDMTKDAPYAGDVAAVYKAYHMFAGLPISPPGVLIERRASSSGRRGGKHRGGGKKSWKSDDEQQHHGFDHMGCDASDDDSGENSIMGPIPPLTAVECGACSHGKKGKKKQQYAESTDEELPPMVAVSASAASARVPPRPPVIHVGKLQAKMRSRLVPVEEDITGEDIGDEYGLPSCSDVFGD